MHRLGAGRRKVEYGKTAVRKADTSLFILPKTVGVGPAVDYAPTHSTEHCLAVLERRYCAARPEARYSTHLSAFFNTPKSAMGF